MKALIIVIAATAALAACNQARQRQPASRAEHPASADEVVPAIPPPGTGPDAKTPLGEPRQPIDPRSAEAAGQVVQQFGALIEQKRLGEAAKLWSNADAAAAFTRKLHAPTHLEIGELGEAEGAAGSLYISVPVVFYSDTLRRRARVVLRRVNDVPGSTDEQRHWHIERIDWSARA